MTARVTGLSVSNYKGVKQIELHPTGSVIILSGANGEGKSSFIDAIAEIIDPKGTKLTSRPIREGEDRAEATITTDTFIATRTWTKNDGGKLVVKAHDGATYPSPAAFMQNIVGAVPFDPMEFARLSDRDQRNQLLARVALPFDLDELEGKRKAVFDARTDANREAKRRKSVLDSFPPYDPATPTEEVSASDIVRELQEATESNAIVERAQERHDELTANVERLRAELAEAEKELANVSRWLKVSPGIIDTEPIRARLDSVEETNRTIRAAAQRRAADSDYQDAVARVVELETQLNDIDKTKAEGLQSAEFPVPGLGVDADGITYQGIPFRQVNSADKVKVAFDLVTSASPDLRIVQIKDGSLLDSESLAHIEAKAAERGYLVLVEKVDESGEVGFTVKDGELA